ncbi:MAG TPA: hypothetical protein VGB15_02830 [Longimicrobium sp.]|jgi:hypothetical protein
MKKLQLDDLNVESFPTTAIRGSVAAYEAAGTQEWCSVSYGGTCIISVCQMCYTDDPC